MDKRKTVIFAPEIKKDKGKPHNRVPSVGILFFMNITKTRTVTWGQIFPALCLSVLILSSCGNNKVSPMAASMDSAQNVAQYDLSDIENAGELIAVTISGPETYYDYHGRGLGLQYALAEKFANSMGLRLRMEVARDTAELYNMLDSSKADLIALPLPSRQIKKKGFKSCGVTDGANHTSWVVRKQSEELAEALDDWFRPGLIASVQTQQKQILQMPLVHRRARSVFLNRGKGIVSSYDDLFIRYSAVVGWDWRLLAAQCYQESAFDPEAESWAGAKGLMQIMPSTASSMGITPSSLNHPETNIRASVSYLNKLQHMFNDIHNPVERQKFVLAAYNGGYYHIRDAQRLAQKYRRNTQSWSDVSYFVLNLRNPKFYRDPVVRNGYMIGGETYNYVNGIMNRYADYQGIARSVSVNMVDLHAEPTRSARHNRFTRKNGGVASREDSLFRVAQ